jgi:hypothetical protein
LTRDFGHRARRNNGLGRRSASNQVADSHRTDWSTISELVRAHLERGNA